MNHFLIATFMITALMVQSCNDNSKAATEKEESSKVEPYTQSGSPGNWIVGEWDQQYTCFDKNGNHKLDPDEKKPSNIKLGFSWFRFNADGTCLRDKDIQFNGTYSIQNNGRNRKLLIEGGDKLRYTIAELTDRELVLGADGAFIVFKRIQ